MSTTRGRFVFQGMAWGLLLAILTRAIPRAEAIFADLGVQQSTPALGPLCGIPGLGSSLLGMIP